MLASICPRSWTAVGGELGSVSNSEQRSAHSREDTNLRTEKDDFRVNDRRTLVIADDNAAILDVIRDLLSASFMLVAQAGDGLEAFRAINEHRPQLAVLDLSMPKI